MFDNLYGFNQEEILPTRMTNSSKRNRKVEEGAKTLLENMQAKKEMDKHSKIIQEQMAFEQRAKGLSNPKYLERRKTLLEDSKIMKNLTKLSVTNFLAETVINGLIFDEEYIDRNRNKLKNNLLKYLSETYDAGIITEKTFMNSDSILVQEAYEELNTMVNLIFNNKDKINLLDENAIMQVLNEAPKAKDLSENIANNVKDKVEDTLEKEKKISKKKDAEKKEKDEEEAADSLDDDDLEDDETDLEDESEGESDDDLDDDLEGEDDDLDDNDDESDDDLEGEDDDLDEGESDDDLEGEDDDLDEGESDDDLEDESEGDLSSKSNNLKITVETNGTQVTVSANKNEAMDYINIFGSQKYKDRNSKTIFRNLLENTLRNTVKKETKILSESGLLGQQTPNIDMEMVLGESIVQYTLLETLYTGKFIDAKPSDIKEFNKMLNFNRK